MNKKKFWSLEQVRNPNVGPEVGDQFMALQTFWP